jgi:predicted CoA-binding protein
MDPKNLEAARAFLKLPRIAFVGLSRDPKDFSRYVFRELVKRGIVVVPVHPSLREAEGCAVFASVKEVAPPVDGALVMTPPGETLRVLEQCAAAGIRRVWLHRGGGRGAADADARAYCARAGIEAVTDLCPFMALAGAGVGHRLHGFVRTTFG